MAPIWNLIAWAFCILVVTSSSGKNKKLKYAKPVKVQGDKTKTVSSDKAHNGGRKGPMSGGSQGLPIPLAIPFPMIPLQGNNVPNPTTKENNKGKKNAKVDKNKKAEKNDGNQVFSGKTVDSSKLKKRKIKPPRFKRNIDAVEDMNSLDKSLIRLRREVEDSDLNEDEIRNRNEWLSDLHDSYVPGTEDVNFYPADFNFIVEGHSRLNEAYNSIMSYIKYTDKRSTNEDAVANNFLSLNEEAETEHIMNKRDIWSDEENILNKRDTSENRVEEDLMLLNAEDSELNMKVREIPAEEEDAEEADEAIEIVNEDADFIEPERGHFIGTRQTVAGEEPAPSVEEAERQLQNAEQAAAALTNLEMKVGIDPEHLVTDTHKYVVSLQAQRSKYDEDIRAHIEKAHEAEKRRSIAVHDNLSKKSQISSDVAAAKRQLEEDTSKIEEIDTELKELKDIEIMATGLEVAKYLAKEKAHHNLELAQAAQRSKMANQPQQTFSTPSSINGGVQQAFSPPDTIINGGVQTNSAYTVPVVTEPQVYSPPLTYVAQPQTQTQIAIPTVSMYIQPQIHATQLEEHQPGKQREMDNRPSYHTPSPILQPASQPLTQYLTNYLQSKAVEASQFSQPNMYGNAAITSSQVSAVKPVPFAQPRPVTPIYETHVGGDQRHNPVKPAPSIYLIKPPQSLMAPVNYVTSFARLPKPDKVGAPDHEITKIEQSHKTSGEEGEHKDSDESHDDWGGVLSFPGTTYSPPPSWLQRPQVPYLRAQPSRTPYSQAIYSQPEAPHYIPQLHVPYAPVVENHPPITEIAGQNNAPAPPVSAVAPFSSLTSYHPPPAVAVTAASPFQQNAQQSSISAPSLASYTAAPPSSPEVVPPIQNIAPVSFIQNTNYQNSIFPESVPETDMRPGAKMHYAQQNQKAQGGEIINAAPQDEVITINPKPQPKQQPKPEPDMSGQLPGWMGAVDAAKYEDDVSDRLRENTNETNKDGNEDQNVKREYLHLANAEQKLEDTGKAAVAVTHIESAIGFDPGSIAKMVDFVKTAAVKDVKLSAETVEKDKETLMKIESGELTKKSDIAKKSDVDSVALEHAKNKLKMDQAVLLDAEDRLEKIKRMELIVTEIEVAKFYASQKAATEVQGAKRTLEALKRHDVARPQ